MTNLDNNTVRVDRALLAAAITAITAAVKAEHVGWEDHPGQRRRHDRDMELPNALQAALTAEPESSWMPIEEASKMSGLIAYRDPRDRPGVYDFDDADNWMSWERDGYTLVYQIIIPPPPAEGAE